MKRTIKLKESELRHMIAESVRRILKESGSINEFEDDLAFDDNDADGGYPFDEYIGGGKRTIPTDDMLDPY